jgi:hypothetical protein
MRILLVVALALSLAACREAQEKQAAAPQPQVDTAPGLASTVHVRDPKVASQLVSGFYPVEDNAWRWTAKSFTVNLHTPFNAAQRGGTLRLDFTVPPPVTQQLGSITLTASIGGTALPPESYSSAGQYVFRRDVPAALLASNPVRVDFQLDKALPPGKRDQRELGIVVVAVGLDAK